jgi:PAS domain S-box-containing protein
MTTTTRRLPTTFGAIFQWRSLKTRVTVATLTFLLIGIWSLAFYSSYTLKNDMEQALGEQQFSTVSIIAAGINSGLDDRMRVLEKEAALITPAMMGNAAAMQTFIEERPALSMMFNAGIFVLLHDGAAIADFPLSTGRLGKNFMDREYAIGALKEGKTTVGSPVIAKALKVPVFTISAPIHNARGKVIGALNGTVDLAHPNFLTKITDNNYGKTGSYLLVSPKIRTIVYATDKKRIMEVLPAPGINPLIDRYIQGYEGSGITIRPSDGVQTLSSAKGIPVSGWYVAALMPTEEAFAPIRAMQQRMLLAAIFLTLLSGVLIWWMLKRQLAPAFTAIKTLATLADTDRPPQPLPITRQDEIGALIGGFNRLLGTLGQRDEALRESEAQLLAILDATPFPIALVDVQDDMIDFWSQSALTLFGHTAPTTTEWYKIAYPDPDYRREVIKRWKSFLEVARECRQAVNTGEFRITCRDGSVRICELLASFLADRLIVTFNDITERKQAEEEKRILVERLQRSEKMESLGFLAGGVAHDLNNVLGVVVGYAELILESADAASPIKPHLVNIMNGGQKAAAIVNDLLTLARRGVSGKDVLNLNKIIADCQQSPEFEKLYSYHTDVKINTDLEPDQPNITCSSVHLGKSLYNLVSNACEAMPKGGIVTIRTSSQYLDRPIHGYDEIRSGDYVVLSVSDTGEGINNNDLNRIFEPFYTKKVMGRSGTGLGLAVVWGTVRDHNGYINVQSEKGKGSTFTLYFPVTREDIAAGGVAVAISEYMGKGESILVVDDVTEQRDLAAGMLRTLNYNVSGVSSGDEAAAYMKEHRADLMVLDMIMEPGMDGLDTYKSVLAIRPKQKAIIVSGFSESDRVHEAQGLGAGAYVRKPYIKEKLGVAVRKELDRK